MASFNPILSDQGINSIRNNIYYRNSARESDAGGSPVFFVPRQWNTEQYGFGGPRYKAGYTYDNSPQTTYNGNCTWWCYARLEETTGTQLTEVVPSDAKYWYNQYSGDKSPNAINIQAGDIIVMTDSDAGHVMFVEQVTGDTIYISQSAYSTRSCWNGYACRVTNFQKSEIVAGNSINMYKNIDDSSYFIEVVGVIHTGGGGQPEPPEDDTLTIILSNFLTERRKKKNVRIIY